MGERSEANTITLRVKAVPGASRDSIAGLLGDRIKVRVSAAPEGGKANKAIARLLASRLGVRPAQVELRSGQTNPEKLFAIEGVTPEQLTRSLGFDATPAIR
jgi:hypothetical protein